MNIERNNEEKLKEILIWGLCRSGNHALGSFIMEHIQEMPLEYKNLTPNKRYKALKRDHVYLSNYLGSKERIGPVPKLPFGNKQIISVENGGHKIKCASANILEDINRLNFNTERENIKRYIFVILRDPFNWFASYYPTLKKSKNKARFISKEYWVDLWIQYAENFFLNGKDRFWFPVNYNKLCKSVEYRKKISAYIEEPFTDKGINNVISRASTYDGARFNGKALKMDLEGRWKRLPKDIISFLKKNEKLVHLSKEIFNFCI